MATIVGPYDGEEYRVIPGCYVDGCRGIGGLRHLLEQFPGFLTDEERRELEASQDAHSWGPEDAVELHNDLADAVEGRLWDALSPFNLACGWRDGEFYIWEFGPALADESFGGLG